MRHLGRRGNGVNGREVREEGEDRDKGRKAEMARL